MRPENHFDHRHGFVIGHPHAVDETALLAQALQHLTDLRTAAVHHDRIHAHQFHQHHVSGKAVFQIWFGHCVTAVLDDDGAVLE